MKNRHIFFWGYIIFNIIFNNNIFSKIDLDQQVNNAINNLNYLYKCYEDTSKQEINNNFINTPKNSSQNNINIEPEILKNGYDKKEKKIG